jgi:hypothetical protein
MDLKPFIAGWCAVGSSGLQLLHYNYQLTDAVRVSNVAGWLVCAIVGCFVSHSHAKIRSASRGESGAQMPSFLWIYGRGVGLGIVLGLGLSETTVPPALQGVIVMLAATLAEWIIEGTIKLMQDFAANPAKWVALALRRYRLGAEEERKLEETGSFKRIAGSEFIAKHQEERKREDLDQPYRRRSGDDN